MADSSTLVDRVKIFVESSGTGPFQLGNAVPAFRGSEALTDGLTYSYAVESGSDYEVGQGVYVLAVDQLLRAPTLSSAGGAPVAFPANVTINFTALAADLTAGLAGTGTVTSIQGSGGTTGMTLTGGPITGAGTLTLGGTLGLANGGTGGTTAAEARSGIGLGNVDNTSDADKPVSTDTQTALDERALITDLASPTGGEMVGTIDGDVQSDINARKPVVWARPTGGDDTASLNAALAALDTSGGKAAVLDLSAGFATISGPLTVPTRCTIRGNGTRNSGLNLSGATAKIVFDGVDRAGLADIRIAAASNVTRMIEVITTSTSVFTLNFSNIELGGSSTDGQQGIFLDASGSNIISECVFSNILLKSIDRPLIDYDSEGNFWEALTIDQFAFSQARTAMELVGLANQYQARVAGSPFTGSKGLSQGGAGCLIDLATDIGSSATALDVSGVRNIIRLSRPEALTPRGTVAKGNILLDEGESLTKRISAQGIATPVAGNFALADWGSTATVTAITGSDQSAQFTVNSSGTGQAQYPTITYTFADGEWPSHPAGLLVLRTGGSQNEVGGYFSVSITSSGWVFRWSGTPVNGEAYTFQVALL